MPDSTLNMRVGGEMRGHWVGPMEPQGFLDEFLPPASASRPVSNNQDFEAVATAGTEREMYRLFMAAMAPFAPTLYFLNTSLKRDTRKGKIPVDASAYRATSTRTAVTKTDFAQMEIPLVFKRKETEDPFIDSDDGKAPKKRRYPFEKNSLKATQIRGQIASSPSALAGAQFRIHSFSVFICGKWARLLRWDRSGAIVSQRFPYAQADYLVEFFWRYSQVPHDDPRRGHDPTVRPLPDNHQVSEEEEKARARMIEANLGFHLEFRTMMIPDRDTDEEFEFLVSYPPRYNRHSPVGRATRPMLAFDLLRKKLVFAKDYWRPHDIYSDKEGDIYKLLHGNKVPHVASFWKGNDIRAHVSVTDSKRSLSWACRSSKMVSLRHYRMSLEEIGRPLNTFKSSYELVTAIADGMEAHEYAHHDAKILHRDISSGNILITESGRGLLIDWDLCLRLDRDPATMKARRPERTGTWQFLSIAILQNPKLRQDRVDDKESAFHVLVWNLLRYTKHNKLKTLHKTMSMFDEFVEENEEGTLKYVFLTRGVDLLEFSKRPALDKLVQELARTFSVRYERPPDEYHAEFYKTELGIKSPQNPVNRLKNLNDRWWLVETMRKHLEDKSQWTNKQDAACLNPLISPSESAWRKTKQQADIASRDGTPVSRTSASQTSASRTSASRTPASQTAPSKTPASRKRLRRAMYSSSEESGEYNIEEDEDEDDDDDQEEEEGGKEEERDQEEEEEGEGEGEYEDAE